MVTGTLDPTSLPFPDSVLRDLLDVSLTGVNVLRPVYDLAGEIEDFAIDYLNPAGQRMTGLSAQPGGTLLTRFPASMAAGILAYYRRVYADGATGLHEVNYQADGLDNFFRLAARRSGELLVVSFTDTADQDRSAVELALRESQAAERAARADADAQRQRLHEFMSAAPGVVLSLVGPQHVIEFANEGFRQQFGVPDPVGKPYLQALPIAADQDDSAAYQATALYDHIYRTGEPYYAAEAPYYVDPTQSGRRELRYFTFAVQAARDGHGRIVGVQAFATDVTEQVLARQQVEQLNQELETRVQQRTEQVRAQSQRLERLFTQAPAAICILAGPELTYELVNPIYQQFFPERQLLGKPLLEALPELADHAAYHTMRRVFETGEPLWQQALHTPLARTADGVLEDRYFNYIQQARYDEQGRIDGVLGFGFEVTDLVQARQQADALQAQVLAAAERQLQEREAFYQIFAQTPAAICIQRGPEHRYEYANAAYQAFFPGRELLGRTVAEALPETVDSGVVALLDGVYQTGETYYGYELPLLIAQPEGPPKQMYFTFTYQAYRENGEIVGISTFAYDVAPQVLARQEREVQREQLYALFMQAPAAICILGGENLVYELVNPSYQDLFPDRQLLGRPILEALPEIAGHAVYQGFRDVYDTGISLEEKALLIPLTRPEDGALEDRYFNYIQQARRDAHGHIDGVLVFAFEVTEQVQARQQAQAMAAELRDTNQQLVRTNVDLDNFIYTASHDLKAPISNIEGLLYLLQEELPPSVTQDAEVGPTLTRMLEAVERFKRTVDHLTDVSKLQKENTPATTLVNLAAVIEDVRLDLAPLVEGSGAKLVVEVEALPPVQFSEKNLRSIVYNLLSNAVKYHSPDRPPRVDVRAHIRAGHTVLEVHDNGLGIAEAQLPKLFGMFQRFHDHVEGSGIGLYMVKRMVENAGGRIEVHSQLGVGTTFFVFLPHTTTAGAPPFPAYLPS